MKIPKRIDIPPEKIRQWVITNFPDYRERRNGEELVICSPFDGDTGYHFNINVRGVCNDWRGNQWAPVNPGTGKFNTSFINFVKLYLGCSWQQAVRTLTGQVAYLQKVVPEEVVEVPQEAIQLPQGAVPIIGSTEPMMAKIVTRWLATRGVSKAQIKQYNIHHLAAAAVWPYYEYDALVYWQSRSALDKRFLFPSKKVADKDYFYGFDHVEPASHVIITEAIFGAITLGTQALASGGASMNDRLVQKLTLLDPIDGVILAPDNDKAGIQSIMYNAPKIMALGYKVYYSLPPKLKLPDGKLSKDWNDLVQIMRRREIAEYLERGLKPYRDGSVASLAGILMLPA